MVPAPLWASLHVSHSISYVTHDPDKGIVLTDFFSLWDKANNNNCAVSAALVEVWVLQVVLSFYYSTICVRVNNCVR